MESIKSQLEQTIKELYHLDFDVDLTPAPENIPADYSTNAPLKLAKDLLTNSDMTVGEFKCYENSFALQHGIAWDNPNNRIKIFYPNSNFVEIENLKNFLKENKFSIQKYNNRKENLFLIAHKHWSQIHLLHYYE